VAGRPRTAAIDALVLKALSEAKNDKTMVLKALAEAKNDKTIKRG
jgi:hypothetical protein